MQKECQDLTVCARTQRSVERVILIPAEVYRQDDKEADGSLVLPRCRVRDGKISEALDIENLGCRLKT